MAVIESPSLRHLLDRIERVVNDEAALLSLRDEIRSAGGLTDSDRLALDGRVGCYLADLDRERDGRRLANAR